MYDAIPPRKVSQNEIDQGHIDENALLRDEDGNRYEVSEGYYKQEVNRRRDTYQKDSDLMFARELLKDGLHRLTDKQKQVIYYTMQGYHHDAIAKQMDISISAVRKHLELAKKKLAKLFKGHQDIVTGGDTDDTESVD